MEAQPQAVETHDEQALAPTGLAIDPPARAFRLADPKNHQLHQLQDHLVRRLGLFTSLTHLLRRVCATITAAA